MSLSFSLSTGSLHQRLYASTIGRVPHLAAQSIQLLTAQANVIAMWQLSTSGRRAARRAHDLGQWRRITRNVYAAGPAAPTEEQNIWAAALHAGPHSILAGQAALYGSGWKHDVARPIDVLVPVESSPVCPKWIRAHRTSRLLTSPKGGMPRSHPADACLDAAAWARTDREALFIVITCLNKRLVTARSLQRAIRDRPTLPRRDQVLESAAEFSSGAMSVGEVDFSRLCRKYGIRPPDRQVRRTSTSGTRYIDAYWEAERVVVEIDGAGHADIETMRDDHERQNDIVRQGDRIFLRVLTWVLKYEPEIFMSQLADVLEG